ncbi:hypothetical protein COE80_31060 [Bacillus pseudomycoides]|uniref:hypothetical protein n=1 Tax=Bacillus pseudomycoides TaxID=64104 RepID=UPI000BFD7A4A|nr:hypothetical protein [Bacillus pseudomycoides]PHB11470.1 hypothetical protein COE80_31060 [Bacillus pseudomycoides]
MGKRIDLTGQKFGRLTVIGYSHSDHNNKSYWDCVCECKNERKVQTSMLRSGRTKSCGCLQREKASKSIQALIKRDFDDLTGNKYNRLTVIKYIETKHSHRVWECKCDCGKITKVREQNLKRGTSKSCGCYNRELSSLKHKKHGQSFINGKFTPEYQAWANMKKRCSNPNANGYEYWGGRGINYCDRWESFDNFFEDMGSRPTPNHSLDRIDNSKGYCSENCKWTDKAQQVINRRTPKNNKTGVKGVCWHKLAKKYHARITVDGKVINLGLYEDLEEAVKVRKNAEEKYWGNKSS